MSYTKNTWQTGDIVSSAKLNHMEDGIADAQNGYTEETTETVIVPQQSVTTLGGGILESVPLTGVTTFPSVGDECIITFNGDEYEVTAVFADGSIVLGEFEGEMPVFVNYPFFIYFVADSGSIFAENAGTHTVKVTKADETATVDDDFAVAVKTVDAMGEFHINFTYDLDLAIFGCDKTFAELLTAFNNGQKIVAHYNDEPLLCQKLNIDRNYFSFVFVSGISSGAISVDVFGFAIDDTVTVNTGTIGLGGVT